MMRGIGIITAVAAALLGPASSAAADSTVASRLEPAAPAPGWARSIEVVNDGAPAMLAPTKNARRRGTVGAGTRLAFSRRVFGPDCSTGVWYETRDGLFLCEEHVTPSPSPPGVESALSALQGTRLPQRYAFIRIDGTRAYSHPSDYFTGQYAEALGRGFGIVVTGEQVYEGVPFVRSRRHLWIERGSVRFVEGSDFRGFAFAPGDAFDVAWVSVRPAKVYDAPQGRVTGRLARHTRVRVTGTRGPWTKLQRGGFVRSAALARPRRAPPPEGVKPHDRWIDVDVEQQVLVAYEGNRPAFATLISTGKDTKQSRTPRGVFELWAKLDYTDMDDIERTDVPQNYSIQDVPWVQFFKGAYGFHAAFWHDDFGRRRSHGCINLSPADARYLFHFTEPVLPPGWNAILPLPEDHPTKVQIR